MVKIFKITINLKGIKLQFLKLSLKSFFIDRELFLKPRQTGYLTELHDLSGLLPPTSSRGGKY